MRIVLYLNQHSTPSTVRWQKRAYTTVINHTLGQTQNLLLCFPPFHLLQTCKPCGSVPLLCGPSTNLYNNSGSGFFQFSRGTIVRARSLVAARSKEYTYVYYSCIYLYSYSILGRSVRTRKSENVFIIITISHAPACMCVFPTMGRTRAAGAF